MYKEKYIPCNICGGNFLARSPRSLYCKECKKIKKKEENKKISSINVVIEADALNKKEIDKIFLDVEKSFLRCRTVKGVAKSIGCNPGTARKFLVTLGLYTNKNIELVKQLKEIGYTDQEARNALGLSESYYNTLVPFEKGTYISEKKTYNAEIIRKHRDRKGK